MNLYSRNFFVQVINNCFFSFLRQGVAIQPKAGLKLMMILLPLLMTMGLCVP